MCEWCKTIVIYYKSYHFGISAHCATVCLRQWSSNECSRTHFPRIPLRADVVERQLPSPPTIAVLRRKKGGDGLPIQNAVSGFLRLIKKTRIFIYISPVPTWFWLTFNHFPGLVHTNMSGSGRPRTSSFAEPPGAPGSAAAGAGSAVAGGSSTGKTGASQASGSSSTSFGNLKLPSKVPEYFCKWSQARAHCRASALSFGCGGQVY